MVDADGIQELRDGCNRLRGRLFQAVEATGVDERHQTAIKGLIRSLTYDMQAEIEGALRNARRGDTDRG
jgi:hypothetical protein